MISYTIPGMHVREHELSGAARLVGPGRSRSRVFARELIDPTRKDEDLPCLLHLQGGPGREGPAADRGVGAGSSTR